MLSLKRDEKKKQEDHEGNLFDTSDEDDYYRNGYGTIHVATQSQYPQVLSLLAMMMMKT